MVSQLEALIRNISAMLTKTSIKVKALGFSTYGHLIY